MLIEDDADRKKRIGDAVRHVVAQRSSAEHRAIDVPELSDGEIWLLRDGAAELASLWVLHDGTRVVLGDVTVQDASLVTGRLLWTELRALAGRRGWTDSIHVSELGHNPVIAECASAADAVRVATKMQVDVARVPPARGIVLEPMTEEAFIAYQSATIIEYARELRSNGLAGSTDEAQKRSAEQHAELLPRGLATPGENLWTVKDGSEAVGILWVHTDETRGFIYDIEMRETARGRGYGTQTLRAAAGFTRDAGLPMLALNVFGGNEGARRLYAREGFAVTETMWSMPLG